MSKNEKNERSERSKKSTSTLISKNDTEMKDKSRSKSVSRNETEPKKIRISKEDFNDDSDKEDDHSKYKSISKQLLREKSDLKAKLKSVTNELDNQSKEHKYEMEKFQDYFQDQIISLSEQKELLSSEISTLKMFIIEEKEKNRLALEEKLSKYKEIIEKRCMTRDSQVKKLENSLVILQDKLNSQQDEKESLENAYKENEEKFRQIIFELQDQIRKIKEQKIKDHKPSSNEDNKKFILECETKVNEKEKELSVFKLKYKKETGELQDINENLKNQIMSLQNNLKKIQDNVTATLHGNLSKQKESFEKELALRNSSIESLEKKLAKITEESINHFNSFEKKLKDIETENTFLKSKQIESDKMVSKHKEIVDKFVEKIKALQKENEELKMLKQS